MQNLDLWLDYVDTMEIKPLFEKVAREYYVPKITDVDWSLESEFIMRLARDKHFPVLDTVESEDQLSAAFHWLLEKTQTALLLESYQHILSQLVTDDSAYSGIGNGPKIQTMLKFLKAAPFLSAKFARLPTWTGLPINVCEVLQSSSIQILEALVLCANDVQELVVDPFRTVLSQIQSMSLNTFYELVELISLTIHSADIALELILECLGPETSRILPGNTKVVEHFVRNLFGIALEHIDEAEESQEPRGDLLTLKHAGYSNGYPLVECNMRIDAPAGLLATTDHVRLEVASLPANSPIAKLHSTDAIVESAQPGTARIRCFHPLPSFVEECSWELQSCGSFVTTKTMFDAVCKLDTLPETCSISDRILGTRTEESITYLPEGYEPISGLNPSQNNAIKAAISYPVTCLWGPPGTGKTHTIVELIKQLQSTGNRRILVTAPTHNAVDNVMEKYLAGLDTLELDSQLMPLRVSTEVSHHNNFLLITETETYKRSARLQIV